MNNKDDGDNFKRDENLSSKIKNDMGLSSDGKPLKDDVKNNDVIYRFTKRILKLKVPMWLIVILIFALGAISLYGKITSKEVVNYKPLITNAKEVKLTVTMCNEKVDELNLNPRKEELRLEKELKTREKVEKADVSVLNKDCGS